MAVEDVEQCKPRDVGMKRAREDSEELGRTARARTSDEVPAVTLPFVREAKGMLPYFDSSQDTECAAQSMVPPSAKPTAMEIEMYVAELATAAQQQPAPVQVAPSGDATQMQILPSEIGRPKAASEMTRQSHCKAAGSVSSMSPPATPPSSSQKNAATATHGADSSRAGAAAAATEGCGPEAKVIPQLSHFMHSLGISARLTGMRSQIGRLRVPLRPLEKRAGLSLFPQLWCV